MTKDKTHGVKSVKEKHKAQITNEQHTGEWTSEKKNKTQARDAERNIGNPARKISSFRADERNFDLLIDGVPYTVRSVPFLFNDELRFRIFLNGNTEHVFTWDSEIRMLRAIDDDSSVLPVGLEEALSEKLQSQQK